MLALRQPPFPTHPADHRSPLHDATFSNTIPALLNKAREPRAAARVRRVHLPSSPLPPPSVDRPDSEQRPLPCGSGRRVVSWGHGVRDLSGVAHEPGVTSPSLRRPRWRHHDAEIAQHLFVEPLASPNRAVLAHPNTQGPKRSTTCRHIRRRLPNSSRPVPPRPH